MVTTGHARQVARGGGGSAAAAVSARTFRGWRWRAGNALVSAFARAGVGPIALLTTTGRVTGRPYTVPVVPIDHAGARWLVAPYGPVGWVHNARAAGTVTLRRGSQRHVYAVREATPAEAAPVLKRYVTIASRARHRFAASVDAPVKAFVAEATDHPVFELQPPFNPVVVDFPLRGEWTAMRTPAHRVPSHGTELFGQRYAFDFVRTDQRRGFHVHPAGTLRFLLAGGRTRDSYGWGQPIHAAFDGEVVEAVDGVAERAWLHVGREAVVALRSTVVFDPARHEPSMIAGNHVIMRGEEAFALFAHLAPGSVAVTKGQTVRAGDVIGRVGHTGNSTAPHLHFQLMDSADPLRAKGVPCAFREYLVEGDGRWEPVVHGIPRWRERIRSWSENRAAPASSG